jgi:hypothetical protein
MYGVPSRLPDFNTSICKKSNKNYSGVALYSIFTDLGVYLLS